MTWLASDGCVVAILLIVVVNVRLEVELIGVWMWWMWVKVGSRRRALNDISRLINFDLVSMIFCGRNDSDTMGFLCRGWSPSALVGKGVTWWPQLSWHHRPTSRGLVPVALPRQHHTESVHLSLLLLDWLCRTMLVVSVAVAIDAVIQPTRAVDPAELGAPELR